MSPAPAFIAMGIMAVTLLLPYINVQQVSPLVQMLGSGVAAALLSQAFIWWKESWRERQVEERDLRFFALKLAVVLERYAIECAMRIGVVDDHIYGYETDEPRSGPLLGMPLLELPDSTEWRWIDSVLSSEVLALAPRIKFSEGSVGATFDYADFRQGAEELVAQLRTVGFETLTLASKIRKKYGLDPQAYSMGGWDFREALTNIPKRSVRWTGAAWWGGKVHCATDQLTQRKNE
jgi:hypothetical protein